MGSSEEMSGRWLFELLIGALFIGLLLYLVSGSYIVDKAVVAYKTLDLSFTLSTALAIPSTMFVKLAHPHDDQIGIKVDEHKSLIELSHTKFNVAKLHEISHRFIHRKDTDIIIKNDMLFFHKDKDVYIGDSSLQTSICPSPIIADEIVIIPRTQADEKIAQMIIKESPKTKTVRPGTAIVKKEGVLNIIVQEGPVSVTYNTDPLLAPPACHLALRLEIVPLPSNHDAIRISLREEHVAKLVHAFAIL